MELEVRRGEMYFADLSPNAVGCEQSGFRPVLILQNDRGNRHSPTTVIAAITSKPKKRLPTHYMLPALRGLSIPSVVLCEQIRTIDKCRLQTYIGTLDEITMTKIARCLSVSVGIEHEKS
ncbi:MAG: type II toxin-antitoxin system PemK/MazF family toxin [Oscillospiraceae bacterium]|nr:type II toxin-antitoxin system PemK/MazF family toxin [Oscillospiraceae bacterium]